MLQPVDPPTDRAHSAEQADADLGLPYIEHARNGSLGRVFDHVGIAVSDLAASERLYRTVLSVLGVEPRHADAELDFIAIIVRRSGAMSLKSC